MESREKNVSECPSELMSRLRYILLVEGLPGFEVKPDLDKSLKRLKYGLRLRCIDCQERPADPTEPILKLFPGFVQDRIMKL